MKTLEQLEDELAIEVGYGSAEEYLEEIRGTFYFEQRFIKFYKGVSKRYADECAREAWVEEIDIVEPVKKKGNPRWD